MVLIIAEIGINHSGRLDHAMRLIAAAATAGCDVAKFQAYTPFVLSPDNYETQAMLKGLALTREELTMLHAECAFRGIEFMCTPMDTMWLDFITELGVKRIKVGSAQVADVRFMGAVAGKLLPVIISNGMCTEEQLDAALCTISDTNGYTVRPTILSCISKYPTPDTDIALSEIERLRAKFQYCDVGFSCHARSMWPSIAAVYAGATVVEKHICLLGTTGPDIASSLPVDEVGAWVREIRTAEKGRV